MRNPFRRTPSEPEPEPDAGPVAPLSPEDAEELRTVVRDTLWPGFVDLGDVREIFEDYELFDCDPRSVQAAVGPIIDAEWARREAELAAAPGTGDYGRLEAAFEALEEQGVLGRMSFTCCNTCGTTEIDDERTPAEPAPGSSYGFAEWAYAFFHQQDAERLVEPDAPLYLTYSAFRPAPGVDPDDLAASRAGDEEARQRVSRETDRIVGGIVRDALVAQGLDVTWDGDPGARIAVAITDWRKPLPVG